MKGQTKWTGTASGLLEAMAEKEVSPNMVKKYLSQFVGEVLEPEGIRYQAKRTGKKRLIHFERNDGDDANDSDFAI